MAQGAPEAGARGAADPLPDAANPSLFRLAPARIRPYLQLARLDRPIGWQLLLLPCLQSSALAGAAYGLAPRLSDMLLFLAGAIAMRGAGSTFNDIVDRDIDARVERTRARPIPSGAVTERAAAAFLVAQALVGLAVLLCFNGFTIALGLCSLGFVAVYPFVKRFSHWPQAVLGAAFAWGALMGWAAARGALAPAPALLYFGAVAWTIGYDTVYALQDVKDDAVIGVGSTARLFGDKVDLAVGGFYALAFAFAAAALVAASAGGLALVGLSGYGLHLAWQAARLRAARKGDAEVPGALALHLFRSNRDAGLILFGGLLAESLRLALQS